MYQQPYTLVPVLRAHLLMCPPSLPDGAHASSHHPAWGGQTTTHAEVTSYRKPQSAPPPPPRPTTARLTGERPRPHCGGSRGTATSAGCSGEA